MFARGLVLALLGEETWGIQFWLGSWLDWISWAHWTVYRARLAILRTRLTGWPHHQQTQLAKSPMLRTRGWPEAAFGWMFKYLAWRKKWKHSVRLFLKRFWHSVYWNWLRVCKLDALASELLDGDFYQILISWKCHNLFFSFLFFCVIIFLPEFSIGWLPSLRLNWCNSQRISNKTVAWKYQRRDAIVY